MTVASIDIGTNTVLLLIARIEPNLKRIIPLRNEYRIPRIGKGLKPNGEISNERVNLLFNVIAEYKNIIQTFNCDKVLVIGTNALRIAKNSYGIKEKIKQQFGFNLEIISGDKEAEYAYFGAIKDFDHQDSALVIDIGGGSTELIFGNNENISFKKSFNIGSVNATENFLKHSPPLQDEKLKLINEINSIFLELKEQNKQDIIIAVAGTPTTLTCMNKGLKEFSDDIEGSNLTTTALNDLIKTIESLTPSEIKKKYGTVMNGREDVIYAGALILSGIINLLMIDEVIVSSKGIRYGVIAEYLRAQD